MRICYPISYPGIGGSEEYALNLALMAKKSGHTPLFILGGEGPLAEKLAHSGIDYVVIGMGSSFNPLAVSKSLREIKKYLASEKIDIVHTQMLREQSLVVLLKMRGLSVGLVRTYHRLSNFNWKMRPLVGILNKYTDHYIAVSPYMGQKMEGFGLKKPTVILNGVTDINVLDHGRAVGFLGRVVDEREIFSVATAWDDRYPELVIGGTGDDLEKVANLGRDNIKLLGQVTDKADFFKRIGVLILPSREESTLPLVALEAYSAGIPVVSFDLPALRDLIITSEDLVKPKKYQALIDLSLKRLANGSSASSKYQDYYKEKFTLERMWRDTERLYNSLAG